MRSTGCFLVLRMGGSMDTQTWIGCIIAVIVVALLVNDRPITIVAGDEPVSSATDAVQVAGEAWAR
jgi:hypothetical protein